ncbi:MAG: hypothetical protein JO204_05995 [Alphaproteobacteria bacterium]|nr:hypothetical protein [Alphaproteobacteria bacterium]
MTDTREKPPPENETAALVGKPGQRRDFDNSSGEQNTTSGHTVEASSLLEREQLLKLAAEIMPCADLRRYVPRHPAWCRRIGKDVWFRLMLDRDPDPSEIQLLFEAHKRAVARREHEQEVARKERG